MKVLRFGLSFVMFTALFFSQAGYAQKSPAKKDLPNFARVNETIYRGGQPTEEGIRELAKMGVKTVINLRGADERAKREEAWTRAAGMKFINVSLDNWTRPKTEKIAEIEKMIVAPENQPVFVHCKRGADRTGTVIAVYRIEHDGWDARRANEEAKQYGFGWWQIWMKDYINDYYRDYKEAK